MEKPENSSKAESTAPSSGARTSAFGNVFGFSGVKKRGHGSRSWIKIEQNGNSKVLELDKSTIMRNCSLPSRDLRLLDPLFIYPSAILGREKAIVVNLEQIRCVITADEAFVMNSLDGSVMQYKTELCNRLQATRDQADVLPFEFKALELALELTCTSLDAQAKELASEIRPVLDELASSISTLNLERVRRSKGNLLGLTQRVQKYMKRKARVKLEAEMMPLPCVDDETFGDEGYYDDDVIYDGAHDIDDDVETTGQSSGNARKRPRQKGPSDMNSPKPNGQLKGNNAEELRDNACKQIARWFYDAGIAFDAASYPSFASMIEAIGSFGPGIKPPSVHELRGPLLKNEVDDIQKQIKDHKVEWAQKGCSILSDGWRDSDSSKDIVNFLVNSPKRSFFIKSMDVSEIGDDSILLFQMLNDMVEEIGEQNVVQVITDNTSNYVKAGRLLEAHRRHLYWTPCATHCIDLMLEDLGKLPPIKNALKKCMFMNGYIYTHVSLVNMVRRFTNQRNLHRLAVTRFATSFITLAQYHKQRKNLRKMVTSEEWNSSKWSKEAGGKRVSTYILQDTLWRNVLYALKLSGPLVKVLRLVDGEKKSPMGYIYKAIDRAKETIAKSFGEREEHYEKAFKIIDARWECQLHRPLQAAAHFLNPEIFYDNPTQVCFEVMKELLDCMTRLIPDEQTQNAIDSEITAYRNATGLFGHPFAIRMRKKKSPAEWWSSFGCSTPNLQKFAVRVLSLTCSVSGCERSSGVFQHVRDEIEHLMDDDGDMAEMYLTEKKERMEDFMSNDSDIENTPGVKWQSKSAPISPVASVSPGTATNDCQKLQRALSSITRSSRHESFTTSSSQKEDIVQLEMLLEAYFVFIDHTLSKLSSLKEYIDDTEDLINIKLANVQNQLIQFELLLTAATFVVTCFAVVTGVFGMNFATPVFNNPFTFNWVLVLSCIGCGILYFCLFVYFKGKKLFPI